jgi:hypothetical protein
LQKKVIINKQMCPLNILIQVTSLRPFSCLGRPGPGFFFLGAK